MADNEELMSSDEKFQDDIDKIEKVLSVVVKRRKTFPTKCMELSKEAANFELLQLENAKVVFEEEDQENENFSKVVNRLKRVMPLQPSNNDLSEKEERLQKLLKRTKKLNSYLKSREKKMIKKSSPSPVN